MAQDFIEKSRQFVTYCDRFERITLFEITQYFKEYLFLILIWICSLPLFFLSVQWIVLPDCALIIMSSIWYFFDVTLWLPDIAKRQEVSSKWLQGKLSSLLQLIEKWQKLVGPQVHLDPFWYILGPLTVACIIMAAFAVGFGQTGSFLPVFTLFLAPVGLLIMDFYLAAAGCLFLILEAFRMLWG